MSERDGDMAHRLRSAVLVLAVVLGSLLISWFAKEYLGLAHSEFLTALLLLPVVLFFVLTEKMSITFGGVSAEHVDRKLNDTKVELQKETERLGYLGKLEQAARKDERERKGALCLLYADIDGLRAATRERFQTSRREGHRRAEIEIRREIRLKLARSLEDAFFDSTGAEAKMDLFELGEPDVILMARGISRDAARALAELAAERFHGASGSAVTIALLCASELPVGARDANSLDAEADRRLAEAKAHHRGKVWP